MNWKTTHLTNPAGGVAQGYCCDVSYSPPLLQEPKPTKGFVSVDGCLVAAIGHFWFAQPQVVESQFFLFKEDSLTAEYRPNRIITKASMEEFDPLLTDRLIYLATSFRDEYGNKYSESLDRCLKEILRFTKKR